MPVPARRVLTLISAVLVLLAPAGAAARPDGVERRVVQALNGVRGAHGLPRLRVARPIAGVAAAHSRTMARTGVFSHGDWLGRVARAARTPAVGEVLASFSQVPGSRQAVAAVRGWLDSPPHRVVILSPSYRRVGVGRAQRRGVTFLTVDVAR